jgi:hypothetical protein
MSLKMIFKVKEELKMASTTKPAESPQLNKLNNTLPTHAPQPKAATQTAKAASASRTPVNLPEKK